MFRGIVKAGVAIATCEPERIYTKEDLKDLKVWIELVITFEQANQYSQRLSDRIRPVWEQRRKNGWVGGHIPAWTKMVDGKIVLDEPKAKVVCKIFMMAIGGMGHKIISKKLDAAGIVNIAYGTKKGISKKWSARYVQGILKSKNACGIVQRCKRDGDNKHKPVGEEVKLYPRRC